MKDPTVAAPNNWLFGAALEYMYVTGSYDLYDSTGSKIADGDISFGLPGATTPGLHAYGGTVAGQAFAISIHDGPPGGVAGLVIGTSAIMLPLFGGTLVPNVGSLVVVPLDAEGGWHVEFPLPVTLPNGVPVAWMQALMKNSPAPGDVAMTNALKLQAP